MTLQVLDVMLHTFLQFGELQKINLVDQASCFGSVLVDDLGLQVLGGECGHSTIGVVKDGYFSCSEETLGDNDTPDRVLAVGI